MKYGLIVFRETENIGDDIQSYAALKFLPKVDYYVEREHMDTFVPNNKEYVRVLMSGWFLHNKYNFDFSPYIYPFFISTHLSSYKTYGIENEHIKLFAPYLRKYGPIGCRDTHTHELLDKYKIDNYISGCITLTIDKLKTPKSKSKYICCVDVSNEVEEYIKQNTELKVITKTHRLDKKENMKLTYEERFENVRNLLKVYQNATLVVTSRLHCALPCLALGTPVILVTDDNSIYYKDRINSYLYCLSYYGEKDFLKTPIADLLKHKNKNSYLEIRNSLIKRIKDNINVPNSDEETLPDVKTFNNIYVKRKEKINKLLDTLSNNYKETFDENYNLKCEVDYWKENYNNALSDSKKAVSINDNYWRKEYNDLLKNKEEAVKANDDYWRKEYNDLLEKYNQLFNNKE